MKAFHAFLMSMGMFCAIPTPNLWDEEARPLMTACLPLVGAVIGLIWWLVSALAVRILPPTLAALCTASVPFLATGFMHLDGFMDTCDAILSWRSADERRRILKDVHCAPFAVVCVVLLIGGMFAAAFDGRSLDRRVLVLIPIVSRCASAFCVSALKPIGTSQYAGMKHETATPMTALILLCLAFVIGMLWLGARSGWILLGTLLGYAAAMFFAYRSVEGVSGDLAGYALCVGELSGLILRAILG